MCTQLAECICKPITKKNVQNITLRYQRLYIYSYFDSYFFPILFVHSSPSRSKLGEINVTVGCTNDVHHDSGLTNSNKTIKDFHKYQLYGIEKAKVFLFLIYKGCTISRLCTKLASLKHLVPNFKQGWGGATPY